MAEKYSNAADILNAQIASLEIAAQSCDDRAKDMMQRAKKMQDEGSKIRSQIKDLQGSLVLLQK